MSAGAKILIAGVGNIFLGDDAFGVEVVQRLAQRRQPDGVRVVDFGIRGLDLTYALLDGAYEAVILVDAAPRGADDPPGTLYLIEPQIDDSALPPPQPGEMMIETHGMDPAKVLRLVRAMGGGEQLHRILLVGCEPTPMESQDEMETGLTAPVRAGVDEAVTMIESLIRKMTSNDCPTRDSKATANAASQP